VKLSEFATEQRLVLLSLIFTHDIADLTKNNVFFRQFIWFFRKQGFMTWESACFNGTSKGPMS
jgi:hypothetical protein